VEREELKAHQLEAASADSAAIDPALQAYASPPMSAQGPLPEQQMHHHAEQQQQQQQQRQHQQQSLGPGSGPGGHIHTPYTFQPYPQQPHMGAPGQQHVKTAEDMSGGGEMYAGNMGDPNERADHLYYENMCRELGVTGVVNVGVDLIQCNYDVYQRAAGAPYMMG